MATRRTASASIIAYVRASLKRGLARTGEPTKQAHMQPCALGHLGMLQVFEASMCCRAYSLNRATPSFCLLAYISPCLDMTLLPVEL